MSQRTRNPRRLTARPRRSLAKWINPPPPKPGQPEPPRWLYWSCMGIVVAFVVLAYLLLRWVF